MRDRPKPTAPLSPFARAVSGLASVSGVIAAFLLSPVLYSVSGTWMVSFAEYHYGDVMADWTRIGWLLVLAALIYFTASAVCAAALNALALRLGALFARRTF